MPCPLCVRAVAGYGSRRSLDVKVLVVLYSVARAGVAVRPSGARGVNALDRRLGGAEYRFENEHTPTRDCLMAVAMESGILMILCLPFRCLCCRIRKDTLHDGQWHRAGNAGHHPSHENVRALRWLCQAVCACSGGELRVFLLLSTSTAVVACPCPVLPACSALFERIAAEMAEHPTRQFLVECSYFEVWAAVACRAFVCVLEFSWCELAVSYTTL